MDELVTTGPPSGQHSLADATVDAGGAMQQVRSGYTTAVAVQKPRDLAEVDKRLMEEANHAGETFFYGWAVKGKKGGRIEGPSIGLAMAAARCWGNCAVEPAPVQDAHDSWVFTSSFIDLETGFTIGRQFRQSKRSAVGGDMDGERKEDIRFQIGQSKAARNVIVKALPEWLIDRAIAAAKKGVKLHIEKYILSNGIQSAIELVVTALKKVGVAEEQVAAKFKVAEVRALTIDHIVVLRGDLTALQNGEDRIEALFPDIAGDKLAGQLGTTKPDIAEPKPEPPADPGKVADAVILSEWMPVIVKYATVGECNKGEDYAESLGMDAATTAEIMRLIEARAADIMKRR